MAITNVMRNFVVWVDGEGKLGDGQNCTLPVLTLHMDEYRGGGMDIPIEIDLGMEMMEMSFTLTSFDPQIFQLFGLTPGNSKPFTIRGHLQSESGDSLGVAAHVVGPIKNIDGGQWTAGDKTEMIVTVACHYYRLKHGAIDLIEIDPVNGSRVINGVEQLQEQRINLGIV